MDLKGLSLTYLSQELKIIFNGKYEMCYSEDDIKKNDFKSWQDSWEQISLVTGKVPHSLTCLRFDDTCS